MRKAAAILTVLSISGFASGADAFDLEIKSRLVQSLEATDNYQLATRSPGSTYSSISNAVLNAVARTPTARVAVTTDFNYRTFFGPGGELLSPAIDYGTLMRAEKRFDNLTSAYFLASWRHFNESAVQALQLEETGNIPVGPSSGTTVIETYEGGFRRQLSPRDALTWSARGTFFEGSGTATSNTNVSTTAIWTRELNVLTRVSPAAQFESISYENQANTEVRIWRGWIGFDTRLTKRLSVQGSIGGVFLTVDQGAGGTAGGTTVNPLIIAPAVTGGSGSAADWIGDLLITYRFNNSTTLTLAAAQSVGPDTFGTIRKTDIAGLVLDYRINRFSTIAFSGDFSHQTSSSGPTEFYSLAARYGHELTRDWQMALSYRFRHKLGDTGSGNLASLNTGPASSNTVLFTLSRDFTILPAATGGPVEVAPDSATALMASAATWAMTGRFARY